MNVRIPALIARMAVALLFLVVSTFAFAVETITSVTVSDSTPAAGETIDVTVDVNHSEATDDWQSTDISLQDLGTLVDGSFQCFDTVDVIDQTGDFQRVVSYTVPGGVAPGTYQVRVAIYDDNNGCGGVASDDDIGTEIVISSATVTVTKEFSDDNPQATTDIELTCQSGTVDPSTPQTLGNDDSVAFTVTGFDPDDNVTCQVSETDVVGYTTVYSPGDDDCDTTGQTDPLQNGDTLACTVLNDQDPVDIVASKEYTGDGAEPATFEVSCADGTVSPSSDDASPGSPAVFTVEDFAWDGATCDVTEPVPPSGFFVSATTCEDLLIVPSDEDTTCTITNSSSLAKFAVGKDFVDGNNETAVELNISCNTGLPIEQQVTVGPGSAAEVGPGQYIVEFVVVEFDDSELNCTVFETPIPGYESFYDCETNSSGATCDVDNESGTGCEFNDISGAVVPNDDPFDNACEITNVPAPVDIVINKDWVFEGTTDGEGIDLRYDLTLFCDGEIVDGQQIGGPERTLGDYGPGCGIISKSLQGSPQGVESAGWCKVFEGEGPMDAEHTGRVIPEFPSSSCFVVENVEDGAVEVESTCGSESSPFQVSVGNGFECTVTNTVFFEGIPTLSQYGMAIMALLMLGIGLVGFRRYA